MTSGQHWEMCSDSNDLNAENTIVLFVSTDLLIWKNEISVFLADDNIDHCIQFNSIRFDSIRKKERNIEISLVKLPED
jgi:hypothetical protein